MGLLTDKFLKDYILERTFDKNCFTFVDGAGEYPLSPLRTAGLPFIK
jgi:hypothetical protein